MEEIRLVFKWVWSVLLLSLLWACSIGEVIEAPAGKLYASFDQRNPRDTLPIGLDSLSSGIKTTVEVRDLLRAVDSALLQQLIYEVDSLDSELWAYWKLPLGEDFELCLLGIDQHWFRFRYGLLYAKETRTFIDLIPLAYFYGGEGGQVFSESWLLQQKTIISRESERSLRMGDSGEMEEIISSSLSAQEWSPPRFAGTVVPDSSYWAGKEPYRW